MFLEEPKAVLAGRLGDLFENAAVQSMQIMGLNLNLMKQCEFRDQLL